MSRRYHGTNILKRTRPPLLTIAWLLYRGWTRAQIKSLAEPADQLRHNPRRPNRPIKLYDAGRIWTIENSPAWQASRPARPRKQGSKGKR